MSKNIMTIIITLIFVPVVYFFVKYNYPDIDMQSMKVVIFGPLAIIAIVFNNIKSSK